MYFDSVLVNILSYYVKRSRSAPTIDFSFSEKNLKLEKMQLSLQAAEESLKNAKDREVKLEEDWRKGQDNLYARIKELETEIENLKVSKKEENEAVATSTIQIKVALTILLASQM